MKKSIIITCSSFLLILSIVIVVISFFIHNIKDGLLSESKALLTELSTQSALRISDKFAENIEMLNVIASDIDVLGNDKKQEALSLYCNQTQFLRIGFANPDGTIISSDNAQFSVSERWYFNQSIQGKSAISSALIDYSDPKSTIIVVSVPVYSDGQIIGVLFGTYSNEKLSSMLSTDIFGNNGYQYIILNGGEVLFHPQYTALKSNILEILNFEDDSYKEEFLNHVENNKTGSITYTLNDGSQKFASFAPVLLDNVEKELNVITAIPYSIAFGQSSSVLFRMALFAFAGLILIAILAAAVIFLQWKNKMKLQTIAFEDPLTGLKNGIGFRTEYNKRISQLDIKYAAIRFDIDDFREINKIYGMSFGDEVLKAVADTAKRSFDSNCLIGRIFADSFNVFMPYEDTAYVINCIEKFLFFVEKANVVNACKVIVSLGVYFPESNDQGFEKVSANCLFAHKSAKGSSQNNYVVYDDQLAKKAERKKEVASALESAIENQTLEVYYQPKVDIKTSTIIGCEALARFYDKKLDCYISPAEFIPIAEENGMIIKIGKLVFKKICRDLSEQLKNGLKTLPVAVNKSRKELYQTDFISFIKENLEIYNIPGNLLEIEITESVASDNYEYMSKIINELKNIGVTVAVDDFGSGYSSLGMLEALKFDVLKLDKSLIDKVCERKKSAIVLESILNLAKQLRIVTVCEGVETCNQLDKIKDFGGDYVQGFLFAKPMPRDEYEKYLNGSCLIEI